MRRLKSGINTMMQLKRILSSFKLRSNEKLLLTGGECKLKNIDKLKLLDCLKAEIEAYEGCSNSEYARGVLVMNKALFEEIESGRFDIEN